MARGYRLKFTTPGPIPPLKLNNSSIHSAPEKEPTPLVTQIFDTLPDGETHEQIFVGLERSRLEAAKSRNLKVLLDIITEKPPSQPIAKLNREAAITKSWKSIAERQQHSGYEKIIWQAEATNSKLEQNAIEK